MQVLAGASAVLAAVVFVAAFSFARDYGWSGPKTSAVHEAVTKSGFCTAEITATTPAQLCHNLSKIASRPNYLLAAVAVAQLLLAFAAFDL